MPPALPPKPYAELTRGRSRLRFFHGDAVNVLQQFPAASVDVLVTSPPYNLGIQYRSYDDGRPRDEYLAWTGEWVQAAKAALAETGSLFLNVGAKHHGPSLAALVLRSLSTSHSEAAMISGMFADPS